MTCKQLKYETAQFIAALPRDFDDVEGILADLVGATFDLRAMTMGDFLDALAQARIIRRTLMTARAA